MVYPQALLHLSETEKKHVPTVTFGKGDIRLTNSFPKDFSVGSVCLRNEAPTEIGTLEKSDDTPPDMLWIFENTESLTVVIMQLQQLKYSMENKTLFHPKG